MKNLVETVERFGVSSFVELRGELRAAESTLRNAIYDATAAGDITSHCVHQNGRLISVYKKPEATARGLVEILVKRSGGIDILSLVAMTNFSKSTIANAGFELRRNGKIEISGRGDERCFLPVVERKQLKRSVATLPLRNDYKWP